MHDRVTLGVRWTDLDQLHDATSDVEVKSAVERARRHGEFDPGEVEVAEERPEQVPHVALGRIQSGHHRGRHLAHLVCSRTRGHDLSIPDQLVAIAVVAIGMGVHHRANRGTLCHRAHRSQHRLGQVQIEERVDEQ
jgi:hypothetical protein